MHLQPQQLCRDVRWLMEASLFTRKCGKRVAINSLIHEAVRDVFAQREKRTLLAGLNHFEPTFTSPKHRL